MYKLGSLFIFGQKLTSVYVRGCIKNVLLSFFKNTNGCWRMVFSVSKDFTSTKSYWFWSKGFINNSLDLTRKFRPRNFKNSKIDCTVFKKKNHYGVQNLRKAMLLLYDYIKKLWLRRSEIFENELQKRELFLGIFFNVAGVVNIKLVFT